MHQELLGHKIKEEANIFKKHNGRLIQTISEELGVPSESIIDFDLYFADASPSSYIGVDEDYISSPRIDNLFSCFHGTTLITQLSWL